MFVLHKLVRMTACIGLLAAIAAALAIATPAAAQEVPGELDCGFYDTYDDAQLAFDEGIQDRPEQNLDLDGDGVVCEDVFGVGDGEQTIDYATCVTFATQEDAQAFLDGTPTDEEVAAIDPDGNGVACDGVDDTAADGTGAAESGEMTAADDADVASLPSTGAGQVDTGIPAAATLLLAAMAAAFGAFSLTRVRR